MQTVIDLSVDPTYTGRNSS